MDSLDEQLKEQLKESVPRLYNTSQEKDDDEQRAPIKPFVSYSNPSPIPDSDPSPTPIPTPEPEPEPVPAPPQAVPVPTPVPPSKKAWFNPAMGLDPSKRDKNADAIKTGGSSKKKIIIGAIVAVCVIGLGIGGFFIYQTKYSAKAKTTDFLYNHQAAYNTLYSQLSEDSDFEVLELDVSSELTKMQINFDNLYKISNELDILIGTMETESMPEEVKDFVGTSKQYFSAIAELANYEASLFSYAEILNDFTERIESISDSADDIFFMTEEEISEFINNLTEESQNTITILNELSLPDSYNENKEINIRSFELLSSTFADLIELVQRDEAPSEETYGQVLENLKDLTILLYVGSQVSMLNADYAHLEYMQTQTEKIKKLEPELDQVTSALIDNYNISEYRLFSPQQAATSQGVVFEQTYTVLNDLFKEQSEQAKTDTDEDGVSDLEEMCWDTSAYAADSDDDGFSDGQEISGGYDPMSAGQGVKLAPDYKNLCDELDIPYKLEF